MQSVNILNLLFNTNSAHIDEGLQPKIIDDEDLEQLIYHPTQFPANRDLKWLREYELDEERHVPIGFHSIPYGIEPSRFWFIIPQKIGTKKTFLSEKELVLTSMQNTSFYIVPYGGAVGISTVPIKQESLDEEIEIHRYGLKRLQYGQIHIGKENILEALNQYDTLKQYALSLQKGKSKLGINFFEKFLIKHFKGSGIRNPIKIRQ